MRHRSFCANQIRAFNPAVSGDIHGLIRLRRWAPTLWLALLPERFGWSPRLPRPPLRHLPSGVALCKTLYSAPLVPKGIDQRPSRATIVHRSGRYRRRESRYLQPSLDHVFQQIRHAMAVTPFVVVPTDQFEETVVQLDARALIENRRRLAMNEIGADDFVRCVIQQAFEMVSLAFFIAAEISA